MGSLCKKLKKNGRKFWGEKKEDQGAFWVFFVEMEGFWLVLGKAAWQVADFFHYAWSC
jgi:hypothetical protein